MGALYYTNTIQSPLLSWLNEIKIFYHTKVQNIEDSIDRHFFQAQEITELKQQLNIYRNEHLALQKVRNELQNIYNENNSSLQMNPKTELVRTIAYEKFGNLNRVWINVPEYNSSKIYGLIYKEYVAGIVIPKEHKALGLLNSDIKSTYAVYIGDEKAPGIAHGNNNQYITVSFIPAWFKIKIGDEVITSGLDNIFFQGLKVGKVIKLSKSQGYQTALVNPYYKSCDPNYFHLIRSTQ